MTSIPQDAAGGPSPGGRLSAAARTRAARSLPVTPSPGGSPDVPGGAAAKAGEGQSCSRPLGANPVADAMSENELDEQIRRIIADLPDVLRYHTFDSRKSPSGLPDLICAGPGGVLFRELKRQGKKPTPSQDEWLCTLTEGGADADVWRPSDLLSGRIARELAAISGLKISRLTRAREGDFSGPVTGTGGGPG